MDIDDFAARLSCRYAVLDNFRRFALHDIGFESFLISGMSGLLHTDSRDLSNTALFS